MNYSWDFLVYFKQSVTGEGVYWHLLAIGLGWTLLLSLLSWVLALGLALLIGIARTLPQRWLRWPAAVFVHCFRNVPLLVQVFLWFYVVPELLPEALGMAIKQAPPTLSQFLTMLLALTLFTAAKAAELVRAGIEAVPQGQKQAAKAMGFGMVDAYRLIILPQGLRIVVAPLTSDFMNVFKNSAVALTIGLLELTGRSRQFSEFSAQPFEAFIAATLIYMAITWCVVMFMRTVERRLRVPGMGGA
ncbi:amino acid ABC transporter permease [Acidovorax sp. NPDC077693]|uniref:amino acid ABC transporter permease n=1 Tax=unclassified Acidovorax TaxID=2684926 RepID=UPI0037C5E607